MNLWGIVLLMAGGCFVLMVLECVRIVGWEWLRTLVARSLRRRHAKRRDDEDDDPRGGFGGLAS